MAVSYDELSDFSEKLRLSEMVIQILIIIFAIPGNSLVLIATWRERSLHQANKYFVHCLAVADLLVGVMLVPFRLYQDVNIKNGEITSIHLCRFYIWLDVFLETASIYTLTFVSFDRYLKISKPLQYKSRMTTSKSLKIIVIIWLIAGTYATLGMFPYGDSPGIGNYAGGCVNINRIFYTSAAVIAFFLPTMIMIVMYTLIFFVTRKRRKMLQNGELGQTSNNPNQLSALLQNLKTIRMLLVVVGMFLFCWGPFFIYLMIDYYRTDTFSSSRFCDKYSCKNNVYLIMIIRPLTFSFAMLNSALNPLIYACLDQTYKEAFKHLFQRMMCLSNSRRRKILIPLQ